MSYPDRGFCRISRRRKFPEFLDWLVSVSWQQEVHFLWRPLLRDPKDDMVLEAAVASSADYLVTHNVSDFRPAATLNVRVITPAQLLAHFPV